MRKPAKPSRTSETEYSGWSMMYVQAQSPAEMRTHGHGIPCCMRTFMPISFLRLQHKLSTLFIWMWTNYPDLKYRQPISQHSKKQAGIQSVALQSFPYFDRMHSGHVKYLYQKNKYTEKTWTLLTSWKTATIALTSKDELPRSLNQRSPRVFEGVYNPQESRNQSTCRSSWCRT